MSNCMTEHIREHYDQSSLAAMNGFNLQSTEDLES